MLQLSDSPQLEKTASVEDAYELCRQITAKYSKTFYLGTLLMTPEKRRAIWAIYVWCRRTDELVDGPQAASTTEETLDRWERHLELLFRGQPIDDVDVALVDTLEQFSLEIQPFRDMIAGQRMDLKRCRYETFEALELYCYRVAGTVGLMSTVIMGVDTEQNVAPWNRHLPPPNPVQEAVALGIANQLTNILRDVGEDARRGRIYLPLEDLALFNYTEADLMNGVIDDRWRALMQFEIQRARKFYLDAERGIRQLSPDARWPVWSALVLYRMILDVIEENGYDVFNRRAYVPRLRKLWCLPTACIQSRLM
ncbi:15-cis-phytoene synthase CrtB [Leptolyngbya sp. PCC 6406]|uniref:15-cis-phytoene synthase CrtB n=1 Tax=Leptolyngbya sp. PCC 6406 TaxID=1173264 RepID=UPI0002AB9E51|nr:phytoene synthase [Leptolyngbya sp. PCC 6406]